MDMIGLKKKKEKLMIGRLRICLREFFSLIRVFWQLMYGIWKVSMLPEPIVSIFGGARVKGDDTYFRQAHELAQKLVEGDISVLTGGGPGIMEAASCGAIIPKTSKAKVMGIGVTDLGEKPNQCVQEYFELDYFFARKWLLTRYSQAFVVFPGGFGTLDEMAEVLTLIQTKKLQRVPIALIGTEYWKLFMRWLKEEALKHGTIDERDLALFTVTDDLEKVFCLVRDECALKQKGKL